MNRTRRTSPGVPAVPAALVAVAIALGGRTANAEAPAVRTMSLAEAIDQARANQPAARAALARVTAQKEVAKVPRARWLPTMAATAQIFGATANNTTGTYASPGFIDVPRIGGTRVTSGGSFAPYASTLVAIGFTQEIFDFGRIAAEAAAEDARVELEKQRARTEVLDVVYDVEEGYFAVFAAKQIVKASEEAYERARVHRDLAKAGVDSGLRSPIELTRAEADLTRFDLGRIRARGALAVAQNVLGAAVGMPEVPIDVAAAPPAPSELPSAADAIARASARDPRVLAAIAQLQADEARTRAIGAALRPDLSVTGTISARAGGAPPSGNGDEAIAKGWLPNVPNWDVGAVLSWPLFEGTIAARRDAARAEEDVRREEIAEARQRLVSSIRLAYGAVDIARAALPGLQHTVDAARGNYAQADARFRAGLGTSVELADAEALRTDAEIQLALGEFELARARAAFGRAIAEGV